MKEVQEVVWKRKASSDKYHGGVLRIDTALRMIGTGGRLLDIGCGDGSLGSVASYSEVHGLDISSIATKYARKKGIVAKQWDLNEKFPYKENTFDADTCLDVIDYIENPENFGKEIYRILKPGGIVVISFPNIRNWRKIMSIIKGSFPRTSGDSEGWDGGHIHYFTSSDVEGLLKKNNFYKIDIQGMFSTYGIGHIISKIIIGRKFLREFIADGIIIKAVKR